jgi:hypothetical protein
MFDLTKNLKDAAYVLVGLGVISFQQTQARAAALRQRLSTQRVQLDKQVGEIRETFEGRLDTLQERLPERAKELVGQARQAAQQAEATLRTRLNGASAAA